MANNRDSLRTLLNLIDKLLKEDGNEWFHDELGLLFAKRIISEKDEGIKLCAVTIKEHGSIDRYLEAGVIPIISFSKISDERVRRTLTRDNVEMWKHRISHYSSEPDFVKFCTYAFFQIEQMINYFIVHLCKDDERSIDNFIRMNNNKIAPNEGHEHQSISQFKFKEKHTAFSNYTGRNKFDKTISVIAKIRNQGLHRSRNENTSLSEMKIKNDNAFKTPYEMRTAEEKNAISEYQVLRFLSERNYDLVTDALIYTIETVAQNG